MNVEEQKTRTEERRDWPDLYWTAVLQAETEYAHVVAKFLLFHHTAWSADARQAPLFWRRGSHSNFDPVEDPHESEADGEISVKWDGCGDLEIGNVHICERAHLWNLGQALLRCYDWAREIGMDRL